jgi:hypothetical protein
MSAIISSITVPLPCSVGVVRKYFFSHRWSTGRLVIRTHTLILLVKCTVLLYQVPGSLKVCMYFEC